MVYALRLGTEITCIIISAPSYYSNSNSVAKTGLSVKTSNRNLSSAFPNNVFLNRGNHEARRMNEKYKFEDQIRQRYDSEIFELIQDTFKLLPLAATIEDKVFILHGTTIKIDIINILY